MTPDALDLTAETARLLGAMGVAEALSTGGAFAATTPITGATIGVVAEHDIDDIARAIAAAHTAFLQWRSVPAPRRGELVRLLGSVLREHKQALGRLISIEVGKIASEGLGEV